VPFEDAVTLSFHYEKHRNEFTYQSEFEYQQAADAFMSAPLQAPVRECHRAAGDRVRFDRKNELFGVVAPSGFLKTFHRPSVKYKDLGYFRWECGRTDLS
jgi:pyocin large subunit-like protein